MPELKRSLGFWDGLAMVVGIMVGTGIFRTPGLVARKNAMNKTGPAISS